MNKIKNYNKTLLACYLGFITQAITINFTPLLFLTFHRTYGISLGGLAALSVHPVAGLLGCIICGSSVGIMWPGTISITSKQLPLGGTAMFALLAMAGDMGGSVGPALLGIVSQLSDDNIKMGMLAGCTFPLVLIIAAIAMRKMRRD